MNEVENFELGAVLTMTTGYNCTDDFDKVWKLIWFVCDDNMIGPLGAGMVKNKIKRHLLTIHPELKEAIYHKGEDVREFVLEQSKKFGSEIPVTRLGIKLPEEYTINTEKSVKSR